jgi:hypothetical protein
MALLEQPKPSDVVNEIPILEVEAFYEPAMNKKKKKIEEKEMSKYLYLFDRLDMNEKDKE